MLSALILVSKCCVQFTYSKFMTGANMLPAPVVVPDCSSAGEWDPISAYLSQRQGYSLLGEYGTFGTHVNE